LQTSIDAVATMLQDKVCRVIPDWLCDYII
jgi:hypothetical protein